MKTSLWTAEKDVNMKAIFTVMNTTWALVKINGFALNTSSMLKFQLQKHNKSCIGITWRDLIMEAEVFDWSAELSIVTGSNLDPKKY